MQDRVRLDPEQEALLREAVRNRNPSLLPVLDSLGELPISAEQHAALSAALMGELGETGLQPNKEINERGLRLCELLSLLATVGMPRGSWALGELWRRIDLGVAEEQERVDAAALSGSSKDSRYVPYLLNLLEDEASQVRYYALQSLVLDLQQKDKAIEDRCWRLLREDLDEDVRSMAATCLGHIFQGSRSAEIFGSLEAELRNPAQSSYAKGAIFAALFGIAGRPAIEWPGLFDSDGTFSGSELEWAKVDFLRAELLSQT